jgi:hypothetical protein
MCGDRTTGTREWPGWSYDHKDALSSSSLSLCTATMAQAQAQALTDWCLVGRKGKRKGGGGEKKSKQQRTTVIRAFVTNPTTSHKIVS